MKHLDSKLVRKTAIGTVFGGSLLFTAGLGMANAEPVPAPDGLVSVSVGGTTILDSVPADVASNASAAICGTSATDVSALVEQVDTQGVNQTVCAGLPGGDLVLAQNVSAETTSPVVPETSSGSATEGTDGSAGAAEGEAGTAAEAPSAESTEGTEGSDSSVGTEAPALVESE